MDSIKTWLAEVVIKRAVPAAIAAGVAALTTLLSAHSELLTKVGLIYDPIAKTLTLHLTTFNQWADAGGVALITGLAAIAIHHGQAAVNGTPQSGDQRQTPTDPVVGGERKEDTKGI